MPLRGRTGLISYAGHRYKNLPNLPLLLLREGAQGLRADGASHTDSASEPGVSFRS